MVAVYLCLYTYHYFFKRKAKLPVELEISSSNSDDHDHDDLDENCEALLHAMMDKIIEASEKMISDVDKNIKDAQARYNKDYDKKRNNSEVVSRGLCIL